MTRFPARGSDALYDSIVTSVLALSMISMPLWLYFLFHWDEGAAGMFVVPVVIAVNVLLILVVTRDDAFLRRCMISGIILKIACVAAYWAACAYLWGFSVDSYGYMYVGTHWATQAETLGRFPILQPWYGTHFLQMATGVLIYAIGPSFAAVGAIYASAGFWGQYFAYRAFAKGAPKGNRKLAALFMFLLPSIVFWTSMVGKDALLCLGIGLVAYGFVQITTGLNSIGIVTSMSGLALCLAVRPHVAALAAVAATLIMTFRSNLRGALGTLTRLVIVPLAIAVTLYVAQNAAGAWQINDVSQGMSRLNYSERVTSYGGSSFSQGSSLPVRLAMAPFLMFRPFIWEIRNPQMAIAAIESLWLAVLFWKGRSQIARTLRRAREVPIIGFAVLFTLEFAFTMSPGIGNFGLLVRQRVMVLPYTMLLLCYYSRPAPALATYVGRR